MIIDNMEIIFNKLININNDINNNTINSNFYIPGPVRTSVERFAGTHANDVIIDTNKATVEIIHCSISATEDSNKPIYVVVVDNINTAYIDKIFVNIKHNQVLGNGIATVVIIPKILFTEDLNDDTIRILRSIYFGLLKTDPNMMYNPSIKLLKGVLMDLGDNYIPTYDIEMVLSALILECLTVNLWWATKSGEPIGCVYTVDYNNEIIENTDSETYFKITETLNHINSVDELNEELKTANLIKCYMDYVEPNN